MGQTVDSQVVVHNTGNVAITLSGLSGARCDAGTLSVPANPLPVGGSTAYLCSHLITSADGVAGHYSSAAAVIGIPPEGDGEVIKHTANTLTVTVPAAAAQTAAPGTPGKTGTATTTTTTTSKATPKIGVLGYSAPAAPAISGPRACVRSGFHVSVNAAGVSSVTFYLDGHRLKVMTAKDARKRALHDRDQPGEAESGKHRLLARFALARTATSASAHVSRTLTIARC